ncbi:ABC transporter ATP-binding protein [Marinoscillum furvescens]|uniref:Putative ABC transport system ATP-binding protein n=1 Tax=Marinoscillum furvescens DSM 4134 TaxID=1122208 RepID=A0A3D9L948_MARFU|nr:ABC transporter ATP-binding protein [Marinoscillum furvescens]REE01582.1 putative ABC transport system ATP-binding protein [Marinoscillum furvescens DSM 4134]
MPTILEVNALTKTFSSGQKEITVLDDINFSIEAGDTVSIVGPSGSGKTTLLGLCAGLDRASGGSVFLDNTELNNLTEDELATLRNQKIGFVFQNFQLIPTLTALENVMVPLELHGNKNASEIATSYLSRVGLAHRMDHYPSQLSGGEQQRVAIARAFSTEPKILFADEPTGNLDGHTSDAIEELLFEINREKGTTLIIVTHDDELAHKTNAIIRLKGGQISG